ncbi:hypothetical protein J6590_035884 [Homalodisca vitripennis]|nr:hypothetical protein J6590_035884 [Homalodisca vitripennis]
MLLTITREPSTISPQVPRARFVVKAVKSCSVQVLFVYMGPSDVTYHHTRAEHDISSSTPCEICCPGSKVLTISPQVPRARFVVQAVKSCSVQVLFVYMGPSDVTYHHTRAEHDISSSTPCEICCQGSKVLDVTYHHTRAEHDISSSTPCEICCPGSKVLTISPQVPRARFVVKAVKSCSVQVLFVYMGPSDVTYHHTRAEHDISSSTPCEICCQGSKVLTISPQVPRARFVVKAVKSCSVQVLFVYMGPSDVTYHHTRAEHDISSSTPCET